MTLRWKTAIPGTMRFTVAKAIAGLLLTCAFSLSAMAAAEQRTPVSAPVPLGKLTPFWRCSNALGPFLEEGEALVKIPDYVLMGDFKYTKRPQIGAFNIAGVEYGDIEHQNVNAYALAAHCVNHVPPEPFDWVAFSRYYRPGDDPLSHEQTCKLVWDEFERRIPRLKGVSREMHEFGVAPFANPGKHQFVSEEPGALGAALTCQMMLRLRQAGIDRLWHWATYDELPHNRDRLYLFSGQAWLLSIMEAMAGGDTFLFAPLDGSAAKTEDLLAGSFKQGHELLLVSSYNADSANHATESVRFRIPKKLADISGKSMTWTRLAFGQSPHDLIRADLAKAKLLKKEFMDRPDRLGTLREMATGREADEILFRNWDAYKKCWTASLTLKPWDRSVGTLAFDAQGAVLSVRMTPPEVVVISIK